MLRGTTRLWDTGRSPTRLSADVALILLASRTSLQGLAGRFCSPLAVLRRDDTWSSARSFRRLLVPERRPVQAEKPLGAIDSAYGKE